MLSSETEGYTNGHICNAIPIVKDQGKLWEKGKKVFFLRARDSQSLSDVCGYIWSLDMIGNNAPMKYQ